MLDQSKNAIVRGIGLSGQLSLITITHIFLCHLITAHLHDAGLYHILNIFYIYRMRSLFHLLSDHICHCIDLIFIQLMKMIHTGICLCDRIHDFRDIKRNFLAVSLDDICLNIRSHA